MKAKFRWGIMIGLPFITAVVFVCLLYGECFGSFDRSIIPTETVAVSSNVPEKMERAILHLAIYETNGSCYGSRSLESPCGSGSTDDGINVYSQEERLVAITPDGFEMRFTRKQCPSTWATKAPLVEGVNLIIQTNTVLFRFQGTTETNTLGWRIVGKFK
jgi:hypothetical protein